MSRNWKTLSTKQIYDSGWIKVHEDSVLLPDGKPSTYAYLEKPPGIFIIAKDRDDSIYIIQEYRYVIKKAVFQLPSGTMDTNDVIGQAKKELFEETGISATTWQTLGSFYIAPGHETTMIHVLLATDLDTFGLKIDNQEGNESIQKVIRVSSPELKQMVKDGKIVCGLTLASLNIFFSRY